MARSPVRYRCRTFDARIEVGRLPSREFEPGGERDRRGPRAQPRMEEVANCKGRLGDQGDELRKEEWDGDL